MYRLASEALQPFTFFVVFTLLAFLGLWSLERIATRRALPVVIGLLALWVASTPVASNVAVALLESQHPPASREALRDTDAIVVLAGGVRDADELRPEAVLAEGSLVRTLCAARLYHAGPARPMIVAGGSATGPPAPGPLMAGLLVELGVPEEDVIVEDQSRNTFENARESVRLLRERGLTRPALVTEAVHLPRSVRSFHAQGMQVVPAGCNYRASQFGGDLMWLLPNAGAASLVRVALHEWIGIMWYSLTGRSA